jgi:cytochrome P450
LFVPTARNRRFKRELKHVDDYVQLLIDRRLQTQSDKVDFLSLLLEAREEKSGQPLPQKQVRDETITMFAAGQETTANTFTFVLAHLSRRPDVAEKIRREVSEVVGSETLNLGHLQRLPYISAVIHEVTRLYPGVPLVPRVVKTETTIGGYRIPAKSPLFISIYNIHRNLAHWDDPHEFEPERFTRPDTHRARCAFMPFGAGERFCIGNNFAALELAILLALVVPAYDLSLAASMPLPSISITMRPDGPVPMRVQRTAARPSNLGTAVQLS